MPRPCVTDDELQAYLEQALGPAERTAIDAHFVECTDCRALLAAMARALFEDTPAPPASHDAALTTVPLSHYEVGEELARGGIGRVSRARDTRLGRDIALKEPHREGDHVRARFIREAMITARLEHPAIVPVHEAGQWPDGEPFYAMKLVSGETLTARIRRASSLDERLALLPSVIAVAEATAYAHSRGVIHRDLKPANVIVGEFGETVVIDWGLAKLVDTEESTLDMAPAQDDHTQVGAVLGTPAYMAPEQARGGVVDERADVYALGAILYETLAGVSPYQGAGRDVIAAVIGAAPTPVERREPGIPRDLVAIVRKAMERAPADRYPTALEMAADLRHFQTGQLVGAREYSRWALLVRWLRRHLVPATVTVAALLVVATVVIVSVRRIVRSGAAAERAQAVAEQARAQAVARNSQLVVAQARAIVERDPTRALAWLQQIPVTAPLWDEARAIAVDAINRGFARHVWYVATKHWQASFSRDGRLLASAGADREIRIVDHARGVVRSLTLGSGATIDIAFTSLGELVAAVGDGMVAVYPSGALDGDGTPPRILRHAGAAQDRTFLAVSRDGRQIALVAADSSLVTVLDARTGAARTFPGAPVGSRDIAFSPDGALLATVSIDRVVHVLRVADGTRRDLTGTDVASHVVFTPDGKRLLTAELGGIREWVLETGQDNLLPFPKQRYLSIAISPDGKTAAAAGFEGAIQLLDLESAQVTTLWGHDALVTDLEFSPDGHLLASAAMDHTLRLWELPAERGRVLGRVEGKAVFPVISPDRTEAAVGTEAGDIVRFSLGDAPARHLHGHTGAVFDLQYAPDGKRLASQSKDRTVRLWELATGESRVVASTASWVDFGRLMFAPDGRWLAVTTDLTTLQVLDAATGERRCTFGGHGFNLAHAFSPDGAQLAFTANEHVRIADLTTCEARDLYDHDAGKSAYALRFSRDGRYLASASDDTTIGLYDLRTHEVRRLRGHDGDVVTIAFAPDGRTLGSGGSDRTVRLWDLATGTARVLRGHQTLVSMLEFSPDGRTIASAGLDQVIRVWDAATGAGGVLLGHRDRVVGIAFSSDGQLLVSGSHDGTVRAWTPDPLQGLPVAPAALQARLGQLTTVRIDAQDRALSP